jgi:threonine dehydrogenase-like Zn-dependent dehydrogenase
MRGNTLHARAEIIFIVFEPSQEPAAAGRRRRRQSLQALDRYQSHLSLNAELLPDVLEGQIEPKRAFERVIGLDAVPDDYRAMNEREAIKIMVKP